MAKKKVKKAVKKVVKKGAKKAAKKTVKKAAKRIVKKTPKKVVKKAPKKTARKAAPRRVTPPKAVGQVAAPVSTQAVDARAAAPAPTAPVGGGTDPAGGSN